MHACKLSDFVTDFPINPNGVKHRVPDPHTPLRLRETHSTFIWHELRSHALCEGSARKHDFTLNTDTGHCAWEDLSCFIQGHAAGVNPAWAVHTVSWWGPSAISVGPVCVCVWLVWCGLCVWFVRSSWACMFAWLAWFRSCSCGRMSATAVGPQPSLRHGPV